jgi:hypothetical protein
MNDIMRLDHGPGLSLDDDLLAASLKALTADQFSVELMVLPATCEPICVNQAMRTVLLATMPMLDDVDIAAVQRGDLSRGMAILGINGLGGVAGGHGRGGGPAGGSPTGCRGGGPAGSWNGGPAGGGGPVGGSGPAPAPSMGKEKQVQVVLDDDEVSSDEDALLQKRL